MAWEYKRTQQEYLQVPEGDHRIRVLKAEKAVSKKGNDMIKLEFQVSGMNLHLFHYISFLDDKPEVTNRMLTQFFDGFGQIDEGDFDMTKWIGKVGACRVKHDDDGKARIGWFIRADRQDSLPPWKEPTGSQGGGSSKTSGSQVDAQFSSIAEEMEEYLPFN